jgi:acyl-CoA:acyl-CoA alkyltransferase
VNYTRVHIDALGYQLAPVVVSSDELEERIAPLYASKRMAAGQLEALTGIRERRWWEEDHSLSENATASARHALSQSNVQVSDLGAVVYTGVNRENFEPATACHVASALGVSGQTQVYDICNACLGMLNGMFDIANQIELGQIKAGLVVSCETAREINDIMIERMLSDQSMDMFVKSMATLTGGSGAAAILLTDGSFGTENTHRLLGGVSLSAPDHFELCSWGLAPESGQDVREIMITDAPSVLKYGVELGAQTWQAFCTTMGWTSENVDKVICHQVGKANREIILNTIGVSEDKDFSTFEYLGNMGTVSVPITAAIAAERDFLCPGDRVAFLGIGSGLNCMMLGIEW